VVVDCVDALLSYHNAGQRDFIFMLIMEMWFFRCIGPGHVLAYYFTERSVFLAEKISPVKSFYLQPNNLWLEHPSYA
jgi:hypothetical protein